MATNSGVRIIKNDLERIFRLYRENVPEAVADGLQQAGDAGTMAMRARLESAVTYTGEGRAAEGRFVTGALFDSIKSEITESSTGAVSLRLGFIDGPEYAQYQELGTYERGGARAGGGAGGIEPMFAVQAGFTVLASQLFERLSVALSEAGEDAAALRAYRRGQRVYR